MKDYFVEKKQELEKTIPDFDSPEFEKLGNKIRKGLQRKESEYLFLIRRLKILVLGDWHTEKKRKLLSKIKNNLLQNGLYAETIDCYYDTKKGTGLGQIAILEYCCMTHQLIVFIDGEGKGTITEQNYLAENYLFHGKTIFFIERKKFDRLKNLPSEYIKSFPAIIPYATGELLEKILIFCRLRIYRLASIIEIQVKTGKGLYSLKYEPWKRRLKKGKHKVNI